MTSNCLSRRLNVRPPWNLFSGSLLLPNLNRFESPSLNAYTLPMVTSSGDHFRTTLPGSLGDPAHTAAQAQSATYHEKVKYSRLPLGTPPQAQTTTTPARRHPAGAYRRGHGAAHRATGGGPPDGRGRSAPAAR